MWHRVQMINNFETRFFAEIVYAGNVEQVIERKIVSAEFRDFAEIACGDCVRRFATKFSFLLKLFFKPFVQRLDCFLAGHLLMTFKGRRSACRQHEMRQAMRLPYNSNLQSMQSCERFLQSFCQLRCLVSKGAFT